MALKPPRPWLTPLVAGGLIVASAMVIKVQSEAVHTIAFVDEHGAESGDGVLILELGFAAAQRGTTASREAAQRLQTLSEGPEASRDHARRALVAASSGSRALTRPHKDALEAVGAAETIERANARAPVPNPLLRLLAVLAMISWWVFVGIWIVRGHLSDGTPTPRRNPAMLAALASFGAWLALVYWMG